MAKTVGLRIRNTALIGMCCSFNTTSDRLDVELTFVDLLHEFNTDENASRVEELLEAEHRLDAELHSPVILLDDVVQVRTTANLDRVLPTVVEFITHAHTA
jgi:hypothetical protein